jgi:hypothetical protein
VHRVLCQISNRLLLTSACNFCCYDEAVKSLDGKTSAGDSPKLYIFEALEGSRVFDGRGLSLAHNRPFLQSLISAVLKPLY